MTGYPGAGGGQRTRRQAIEGTWWVCPLGHITDCRFLVSYEYAGAWVCDRIRCSLPPRKVTAKSVLAAIALGGVAAGEAQVAHLKSVYAARRSK